MCSLLICDKPSYEFSALNYPMACLLHMIDALSFQISWSMRWQSLASSTVCR